MVFDEVIIDAPPLDVTEDAVVLVSASDKAVMVVRWAHTPRERARAIAADLAVEGKLGGVIMTLADRRRMPRSAYQPRYGHRIGAAAHV